MTPEDAGLNFIPRRSCPRVSLMGSNAAFQQCDNGRIHCDFINAVRFLQQFLSELPLLGRREPLNIGQEFKDHVGKLRGVRSPCKVTIGPQNPPKP
jgi:hypothetical protein